MHYNASYLRADKKCCFMIVSGFVGQQKKHSPPNVWQAALCESLTRCAASAQSLRSRVHT